MNRTTVSILGVALAVVGAAVTLASRDPTTERAGGALAIVAAGALATYWMAPRIETPRAPPVSVLGSSLGRLRGAFQPGTLERERVVFAVQSLEFASGLREGSTWSPDELRALLALPPARFQEWLDVHLGALERGT